MASDRLNRFDNYKIAVETIEGTEQIRMSALCKGFSTSVAITYRHPLMIVPLDDIHFSELSCAMIGSDLGQQLEALRYVYHLLSYAMNAIDAVIEHGMVAMCVNFLDRLDSPAYILEATRILAIIAGGTSAQTKAVLNHNAVPRLINLIQCSSFEIIEEVLLVLGFIAADSSETRDRLINMNIVSVCLYLAELDLPFNLRRTFDWLLTNLCYHKRSRDFSTLKPLLKHLTKELGCGIHELTREACTAICFMASGESSRNLDVIVSTGITSHLIALLKTPDALCLWPALRLLTVFICTADSLAYHVINNDGLRPIGLLLLYGDEFVVRTAALAIGHMSTGNSNKIKNLFKHGVLDCVYQNFGSSSFRTRRESHWILIHSLRNATPDIICTMFLTYEPMEELLKLLTMSHPTLMKTTLRVLGKLARLAVTCGVMQDLMDRMNVYGMDAINQLETHPNMEVRNAAAEVGDTFCRILSFTEEEF